VGLPINVSKILAASVAGAIAATQTPGANAIIINGTLAAGQGGRDDQPVTIADRLSHAHRRVRTRPALIHQLQPELEQLETGDDRPASSG
jgi:hypothetical protein